MHYSPVRASSTELASARKTGLWRMNRHFPSPWSAGAAATPIVTPKRASDAPRGVEGSISRGGVEGGESGIVVPGRFTSGLK